MPVDWNDVENQIAEIEDLQQKTEFKMSKYATWHTDGATKAVWGKKLKVLSSKASRLKAVIKTGHEEMLASGAPDTDAWTPWIVGKRQWLEDLADYCDAVRKEIG